MEQYGINLNTVAEVELVYKSKVKAKDRPKIDSAKAAYEILLNNWDDNTIELCEQFKVLLLNNANKALGIYHVSTGGTKATVVDVKLIFSAALKSNTSKLILAHNHPSGNFKPSQADLGLTMRIKEAGRYLDIEVVDHIIVTSEAYYSLAENGEL